MNITTINDPVALAATFAGGQIQPVHFDWRNRRYRIDAVNGRWTDRQRDAPQQHFSVQAGEETFFLHLDTAATQWWLDQVITE
ncbi:MAG: hypothetical protein GVY16_05690 [Planctomycetes bacterium]|jgi:hypothetical protein|nr:hypothetical protein [Phycisphaerae bacterium]NBB95215.1 hypothetical protein [Planctomycetota bacterium]